MFGLYFSGTGNTEYCIKKFMSLYCSDAVTLPINDKTALSLLKEHHEIIFAYPIYYSNLPKIVRDFIVENNTLWRGKKVFIIATMGFMYVFRAMGYLVSNGGEWAGAAALGSFKDFATTKFLGINCVIWVIILCYVFFYFFMKWTRTGRKIYAVGSNASAAEVSGINVKNIKMMVYVIMGFLAGLGGALQVSVYASAMPDMQQGGEMDVIAACVIGGVSMSGGRGSVVGALLGSLILATIAKALPLVGFDALWQNTIKGVLILVVVVVNVVLQRIADKNALKRREM